MLIYKNTSNFGIPRENINGSITVDSSYLMVYLTVTFMEEAVLWSLVIHTCKKLN